MASLLGFLLILILILAVQASNSQQQPAIDWSALGQVAFLGSFSALSFHQSSQSNSSSISSNHATLVRHPSQLQQQRMKQSSPRVVATTSSPGSIYSICSSPNSPLVFVGGRFDSLNSTPSTANIAIYNPESHSISSLSNPSSIQGSVHSIDCSNPDQIWIAGQFQNPISANLIPNLIIWSPKSGFQSPTLPTQLDGPIYSLLRIINPSGESLIIAGQFTLPIASSSNLTNHPSILPSSLNINNHNNVNTAPPITLGSTLAPITFSNSATWNASPPSSLLAYQDPSNIFCPTGPDGPGNSWELDNQFDNGMFTLNLGTSVPVGGIRLGNSFANGGGTAGFHIVALPNNNILNLNFMNPVTNQLENCSVNCTLSRDFNIPYQDFIFPPNTALTGIQLVITSKFGSVAGLHLLQLLSQGNTAYAVNQLNNPSNRQPCRTGIGAAPSSSSQTTGNWKVVTANTNFPGTVQSILSASVPPGTTPNDGPTLTWTVPVPLFGRYELILQTPGCTSTNDCSSRTSLSVTTSNSDGAPLTTTVDTRNPDDFSTTLYNGTLTDSASGGSALTVTIRLASTVSGSSPATMVANQLVLRSTSPLTHFQSPTSNSVYELVLAGRGAFGDGTITSSSLPTDQSSITAVNRLGTRLMIGSAAKSVISDSHSIFLAGKRLQVLNGTSGVTTTLPTTVPNGGLNGAVNALLAVDGVLYAGGDFTTTTDGTVQGLDGLAFWRYGSSSQVWEPISQLDSGVGLPIQAFQMIGGLLHIFGRSNDAGRHALGIYSPQNSTWVPSNVGVYFGQLTAAAPGGGNSQELYLAGNLDAISAIEAPSSALLSTDSDGNPMLTGLNFQMNQTASRAKALSALFSPLPTNKTNSVSPPSNNAIQVRTIAPRQLAQPKQLLQPRQLQPRQVITTNGDPNGTLPHALTGTTSATILAGAFFKDRELIVGGRFVTSNAVANVGIYDLSMSSLKSLNGTKTLEGSVLAIKVVGDVAWIGGTFVSPSGKTGLDTYNLTSGRWATEMMADVAPYAGNNVTVRTIKSMTTGEVIIGGSFQQVGSLSCRSICMWSENSNQWFGLGNGLKGMVNALEITGKAQDEILAVGRFEINSTAAEVSIAKWAMNSSTLTWTPIGSQNRIPGPIITIAIGELQQGEPNGMFIGGQGSIVGEGAGVGSAYLMTWKDNDWVNVDGLDPTSRIEHIAFVPIRNPSVSLNTQNGIQSDRLLHVGGWIALPGSSDKFASVLYDGHTWFPYLSDSDFHGQPGILSRLITTTDQFKSTLRHIHSVVVVIFISMAIALAIVLLGVLIGFLIGRHQRSKENGKNGRKAMYSIDGGAGGLGVVRGVEDDEDENGGIEAGFAASGGIDSKRSSRSGIETRQARRPTSLLATIDAATSAMAERMQMRQEQSQHEEKGVDNDEKFLELNQFSHVGNSPELSSALPFDHRHSQMHDFSSDNFDEDGLLADDDVRVARWSFDPQLPGEIAVAAGESVEVRDRSNQEWWLVRRADGVEGVVPADWFL